MMRYHYVGWKKVTREAMNATGATRRMIEQLLLGQLPTVLTVDLYLDKLEKVTLNRVIAALESGVLFSSTGKASQLYELMAKRHNIPCVKIRKQARFNEEGCWALHMRGGAALDNSKIQELVYADRVSAKLEGHQGQHYSTTLEWNNSEFAYQRLFSLKQEQMIRDAVAARLTASLKRRAAKAIAELKQGGTIRFIYNQ